VKNILDGCKLPACEDFGDSSRVIGQGVDLEGGEACELDEVQPQDNHRNDPNRREQMGLNGFESR
jgi:hypothetical protein